MPLETLSVRAEHEHDLITKLNVGFSQIVGTNSDTCRVFLQGLQCFEVNLSLASVFCVNVDALHEMRKRHRYCLSAPVSNAMVLAFFLNFGHDKSECNLLVVRQVQTLAQVQKIMWRTVMNLEPVAKNARQSLMESVNALVDSVAKTTCHCLNGSAGMHRILKTATINWSSMRCDANLVIAFLSTLN